MTMRATSTCWLVLAHLFVKLP